MVKKKVIKVVKKTSQTEAKSATAMSSKLGLSLKQRMVNSVKKVTLTNTFGGGGQKQVIFAMLESEAEVQARIEAEALNESKLSLRGILWACVTGHMLISSVKTFAKKKRVKRTAKFIEIYSNNRDVT